MLELVLNSVILQSKICPLCELCSFTILSNLLHNKLFLCWAMNWLFLPILHWWLGNSFLDMVCRACLILAFSEQKHAKIWRGKGPIIKKMPYLDSPHSNTQVVPISIKFQKHCTDIVSVMWPESFEMLFKGVYFNVQSIVWLLKRF